MRQRSFNRLMAVFTVVIILFLFAASYLHAEDRIPSRAYAYRTCAIAKHSIEGKTDVCANCDVFLRSGRRYCFVLFLYSSTIFCVTSFE